MTILAYSGVTRTFFCCVLRFILLVIFHEAQRRTQEKNILDTSLHSPTRWHTNTRAKKSKQLVLLPEKLSRHNDCGFADNLFLFCLK
jgi:hypothetical protein